MKIMPVKLCDAVGCCKSNPAGYKDSLKGTYYYREPAPTTIAAYALERLEEARLSDEATHAANTEAMENNKTIVEQINALMAEIGMPDGYSEIDNKSMARYPKKIHYTAGYKMDIARHVATSDGYETAMYKYNSLKSEYDKYVEQVNKEAELAQKKAQIEADKQKAERRANLEIAAIILRYNLDPDSEWRDILSALREKNQRLNLAVAMEMTCNNWSDGPDDVEYALGEFTIATEEDRDIECCINGCCGDNWDDDGRIFRDCEWNYNELYKSIEDQQLVTDAKLALAKVLDE